MERPSVCIVGGVTRCVVTENRAIQIDDGGTTVKIEEEEEEEEVVEDVKRTDETPSTPLGDRKVLLTATSVIHQQSATEIPDELFQFKCLMDGIDFIFEGSVFMQQPSIHLIHKYDAVLFVVGDQLLLELTSQKLPNVPKLMWLIICLTLTLQIIPTVDISYSLGIIPLFRSRVEQALSRSKSSPVELCQSQQVLQFYIETLTPIMGGTLSHVVEYQKQQVVSSKYY